jgi:hypothetical protein
MKDLIEGMAFLNIPTKIAIMTIVVFLVLQIIGELLEFKGKAVPEFVKIRKYFARKKKEHDAISKITELLPTLQEIPTTLDNVKDLLDNVSRHYNDDNISMRNEWIKEVNSKLDSNDKLHKELSEKLDKNNEDTLSLLIESKRNTIIDFASRVIDKDSPVTREQFNRIFKLYDSYEEIIEANHMTNGEVDIAYRIIKESYENHMRSHSFIEDIRGYD